MLSLILAAMAGGQTVDPAMVRAPWDARCNERLAYTSVYTRAELKRLGELPRGFRMLAVDKRVAGCSVTVLPQRDATGQHLMVRTPRPGVHTIPAGERSKPQHRLQGHR